MLFHRFPAVRVLGVTALAVAVVSAAVMGGAGSATAAGSHTQVSSSSPSSALHAYVSLQVVNQSGETLDADFSADEDIDHGGTASYPSGQAQAFPSGGLELTPGNSSPDYDLDLIGIHTQYPEGSSDVWDNYFDIQFSSDGLPAEQVALTYKQSCDHFDVGGTTCDPTDPAVVLGSSSGGGLSGLVVSLDRDGSSYTLTVSPAVGAGSGLPLVASGVVSGRRVTGDSMCSRPGVEMDSGFSPAGCPGMTAGVAMTAEVGLKAKAG